MQAEIITIGDELLIGQTVDTNSAWIGAEMSKLGFDVYRITSISDKRTEILKALSEATGRSEVILITGGLGPTSDDITKQTLCDFFGTRLVMDNVVYSMIEKMLSRRNFPMNDNNRKQADVPESCRVLYNETGTAPGMWFEKGGSVFISMPGVPLEMKHIMSERVLPELAKRFTTQKIVHKNIMTYGMPEAKLAEVLTGFEAGLPESIRLAYLPSFGIIKLRMTAKGKDSNDLEKAIAEQKTKLYQIIPQLIYGEDEETLEMAVGRLLREKKATLSTAESCTGGNISHLLTSVPGSSDYFIGSVIAYDNSVKTGILNVPLETIMKHGAVSFATSQAMAIGVRDLLGTDYSIGITGIAGPSGGTDAKPVGTVWISVASPKSILTEKFVYGFDRMLNIRRSSLAALNMLRKQIINEKGQDFQ
jgi:nicotinamide-nucleotide amidase